jgi:hypothetical protein
MRLKRFFVFIIGMIIILGIALNFGLGDLIYKAVNTKYLEVQAENKLAQQQLMEEQNERLQILPLAWASFIDANMNFLYAIADRVLLVGIIIYLLWDKQNDKKTKE